MAAEGGGVVPVEPPYALICSYALLDTGTLHRNDYSRAPACSSYWKRRKEVSMRAEACFQKFVDEVNRTLSLADLAFLAL